MEMKRIDIAAIDAARRGQCARLESTRRSVLTPHAGGSHRDTLNVGLFDSARCTNAVHCPYE